MENLLPGKVSIILYVKTDRHRNRFSEQTGTAPNDAHQPKRRNELAEELAATSAGAMPDL
jgi:hypothetical protein